MILTDYIRKEFLNTPDDEVDHINKIGVLPIFHYLRTSTVENEDLAVLTGSIVIIHQSLVRAFRKDDVDNQFWFSPLNADDNFVEVRSSSSTNKNHS